MVCCLLNFHKNGAWGSHLALLKRKWIKIKAQTQAQVKRQSLRKWNENEEETTSNGDLIVANEMA